MNSDQPSREQIEARITALLLGELPAAEAELLRWTISQDADLQKLHDELQSTIILVRETVKPTNTATAASGIDETPALSRILRTPAQPWDFGPFFARWYSKVSAWVLPPPN